GPTRFYPTPLSAGERLAPGWRFLILATHELALALGARSTDPRINGRSPRSRSRSTEDKATGVVLGLILRTEDGDSRSGSQENDSRTLIGLTPSRPRENDSRPTIPSRRSSFSGKGGAERWMAHEHGELGIGPGEPGTPAGVNIASPGITDS